MANFLDFLRHHHEIGLPTTLGACVIDPKIFFKTDEGTVWKQKMEEFCTAHPEINFNRGKLKAHIIVLALDYHRAGETRDKGTYISQKTLPNAFALKPQDPGYDEDIVESVALTVIKMVAVFFVNVITLGIASLIWMKNNNQRIQLLKDKKEGWKEFMAAQSDKLSLESAAVKRMQEILGSASSLENEVQAKNTEKGALLEIKNEKIKDQGQLGVLNTLLRKKSDLESEIAAFFEAKDEDKELAEALAFSNMKIIDGIDSRFVGFVPLRYKVRANDYTKNIPVGDFRGGISGKFDATETQRIPKLGPDGKPSRLHYEYKEVPSRAGRAVNNKKTMEDLLRSVFDWALESLTEKTKGNEIAFEEWKIHSPPYVKEHLAFYKYMVYLMIDTAELNVPCNGVPELNLNRGPLLQIVPSVAYRTKSRQGEGYDVLYHGQDGWTPTPSISSQLPRGLDPHAVKWILARLNGNKDLREKLEKDIKENGEDGDFRATFKGIIKEENVDALQELQNRILEPFLKADFVKPVIGDREAIEDVALADKLIEEIAISLQDRYQHVINEKLHELVE